MVVPRPFLFSAFHLSFLPSVLLLALLSTLAGLMHVCFLHMNLRMRGICGIKRDYRYLQSSLTSVQNPSELGVLSNCQ